MDYPSSEASGDGYGPTIFGLEAFDYDYQYDRLAANPTAARMFGLTPRETDHSILRPVDVNSPSFMFKIIVQTVIYASVVLAVVGWMIEWILHWIWPSTRSLSVVLLLQTLCILTFHWNDWRTFPLQFARCILRRPNRDIEELKNTTLLALMYCLLLFAFFLLKKSIWILFRPIGYVPAVSALMYRFELLDFIPRWVEKAGLFSASLKRRCRVRYLEASKKRVGELPQSRYVYSRAGPTEIRLLELRRAHPWGNLMLHLDTHVLRDCPQFDAISYTWGNPNDTKHIQIGNASLNVNSNAYEVLHAMAPLIGSRLIWIDSVCIDQASNDDKNVQVALMAEIYRKARRTYAYLGDAGDAEYAIIQLKRLRRMLTAKTQDLDKTLALLKQEATSLDNYLHWHALARLLAHSYWSRVWIVQEIAVSKNIDVVYGTHRFRMQDITETVEKIWASKARESIVEAPWKDGAFNVGTIINHLNINVTAGIRRSIGQGKYPELNEIVRMTWLFDATNPRDKIFAFYNISGSDETRPSADYNMSVEEAYTLFAARFLAHDLSRMLFMAGLCQPRKHAGLPTWVPDFTTYDKEEQQIPVPRTVPPLQDAYEAGTASRNGSEARLFENDRIIARGYRIDHITQITSIVVEQRWSETYEALSRPLVKAFHDEAVALVLGHLPERYRAYDESRRQAFIRTIISDRTASVGKRAPRKYKSYYRHWVASLAAAVDGDGVHDRAWDHDDDDAEDVVAAAGEFDSAVVMATKHRRFAITSQGYMALVPRETAINDVICVLQGVEMPFVLRPGVGEEFDLVGPCYCHGIMDGEAMKNEGIDYVIR